VASTAGNSSFFLHLLLSATATAVPAAQVDAANAAMLAVHAGLNAAGYFNPEAMFWKEGQPEWKPLKDLPELAEQLAQAPPAGAPAAPAQAAAAGPEEEEAGEGEEKGGAAQAPAERTKAGELQRGVVLWGLEGGQFYRDRGHCILCTIVEEFFPVPRNHGLPLTPGPAPCRHSCSGRPERRLSSS
jgi:hypothetical protein